MQTVKHKQVGVATLTPEKILQNVCMCIIISISYLIPVPKI